MEAGTSVKHCYSQNPFLQFQHKLNNKPHTLKNNGNSCNCSVTAVEKALPALAINHFRTVEGERKANQPKTRSKRIKEQECMTHIHTFQLAPTLKDPKFSTKYC